MRGDCSVQTAERGARSLPLVSSSSFLEGGYGQGSSGQTLLEVPREIGSNRDVRLDPSPASTWATRSPQRLFREVGNYGVTAMKRREGSSPLTSSEEAADEAMNTLTQLFSSRELANKAHFRCSIDGPIDLDVLFESVLDEVFGRDPSSDYKHWVRRLFEWA
jgi:hypothetical protein